MYCNEVVALLCLWGGGGGGRCGILGCRLRMTSSQGSLILSLSILSSLSLFYSFCHIFLNLSLSLCLLIFFAFLFSFLQALLISTITIYNIAFFHSLLHSLLSFLPVSSSLCIFPSVPFFLLSFVCILESGVMSTVLLFSHYTVYPDFSVYFLYLCSFLSLFFPDPEFNNYSPLYSPKKNEVKKKGDGVRCVFSPSAVVSVQFQGPPPPPPPPSPSSPSSSSIGGPTHGVTQIRAGLLAFLTVKWLTSGLALSLTVTFWTSSLLSG